MNARRILVLAILLVFMVAAVSATTEPKLYRQGTAASNTEPGYPVLNAVDRVVGTDWYSGAAATYPIWFQVDYGPGNTSYLESYQMTHYAGANYYFDTWVVQGTNDNSSWSKVLDYRTGETFAASTSNKYWFRPEYAANKSDYRYYRILGFSGVNKPQYTEFYFYNEGNVSAAPPVASFNQTHRIGLVPTTATFNDTSTNTPTSWVWKVNGVSEATTQNYTRLFSTGGNYTINLSATNGVGTGYSQSYIEIFNATSGDFAANDTTGVMTLPVLFTPTVFNATTYNWSFGDGNVSASESPTHTYNALGTFDVKLLISNGYSSTWINKTGYITVSTTPVPVTDFSGTPVTGVVPLNVTFTDSSTESPTQWNYTFGDGNYSYLQNPVYQYLSAGTYTVSLNATNAGGSNTNTKSAYITVLPMTATFSANKTSGVNPMTVQFTASSTGVADAWYWEFGDGNTSTSQNPVFVYGVNGTFNVSMRATNLTCGAFDWENKTGYITVSGSANGFNQQDIELDPEFTLTIHITDSSTGAAIPVNTVTTSDGQTYTTTNGTAYFTEPYSTVVVYVTSTGYYGASTSYVMDENRDETIQLTKSQASDVQQQVYPHYVTFHIKEGFGSPVEDVEVSVIGVSTSTGNWDWVAQLLGLPLDEVPINGTYMNQTTDSLGRATFYLIPTGKYNISFTKTGYTITPMVLVPQDTDYVIFATEAEELYFREGVDEISAVNITITTTAYNESYSFINLTYYDSTGKTTGGTIQVLQKSDTPWAANTVMATWPVTGNSFTNSTAIMHVQQVSGYVSANITHTSFGYVTRSYPYAFNSVPVQFLGFGQEIALLVAFGMMAFTLMLAGAAHVRPILFLVCIEGWVFDSMHWFDSLIDRGVPHEAVWTALTIATIIAVLANFEMRKKKEKY